MEDQKDIIVADRLGIVRTDCEKEYLAHLLCLGGTCRYRFNGRPFELHAGDVSIVRKRKMLEKIEPSDDFRCKIIYATPGFINLCTPQSNYGIKGSLALFLNPVMHLTPEQQIVCRRDFDLLELRIKDTEHRFYREVLINAMQAAILDFFDFHARIYGESDISTQNASVMSRFLKMLEEGTYREHREVTYYADRLCVTSKYLSEVSKKVSGYAANYWINRYTILDITRLLRDKSLTFVQISDMFGFSSPAYFSRYVQQNLQGIVMASDYLSNFYAVAKQLTIPPKTILLEEGKVADKLYLIRKGCLRLFFYNDGKDITFQFFFEGDFVASFDSLYKRTPSLFYLESIEPAEVAAIKRNDFYAIIKDDPRWRQAYEEKLIDRFHSYQQLFLSRIKNTPQQRYEELLKEYPNIIQRVPQHYIASYLGITPVSLSRIRNRR